MQDTFITIVVGIAVIIIMFICPYLFLTNQNDVTTKNEVQSIVTTFVDTVSKEKKIKTGTYYDFIEKLNATGNTYYVEVEVKILCNYPSDNNINRMYVIGENTFYSEFTNEIEKKLEEDGEYPLKKGDYIRVKVENSSKTQAKQLEDFIYGTVGQGSRNIEANVSRLVSEHISDLPAGNIGLAGLDWKWDYLWEGTDNWMISNPNRENSDEYFPFELPEDGSEFQLPEDISTSQDNNWISEIRIREDSVSMVGNCYNRGKGAAWAEVKNGNITKLSFDYNIQKGHSFHDAGIMFNIKENYNPDKTIDSIEGYLISFNYTKLRAINNEEKANRVTTESARSPISNITGSIFKFKYYVGNYNGPEYRSRNKYLIDENDLGEEKAASMHDSTMNYNTIQSYGLIQKDNLEKIANFDAGLINAGDYKGGTFVGKMEIEVIDEGYRITMYDKDGKLKEGNEYVANDLIDDSDKIEGACNPIIVPVDKDKMGNRRNIFGFYSEHFGLELGHVCTNIGFFELRNIALVVDI